MEDPQKYPSPVITDSTKKKEPLLTTHQEAPKEETPIQLTGENGKKKPKFSRCCIWTTIIVSLLVVTSLVLSLVLTLTGGDDPPVDYYLDLHSSLTNVDMGQPLEIEWKTSSNDYTCSTKSTNWVEEDLMYMGSKTVIPSKTGTLFYNFKCSAEEKPDLQEHITVKVESPSLKFSSWEPSVKIPQPIHLLWSAYHLHNGLCSVESPLWNDAELPKHASYEIPTVKVKVGNYSFDMTCKNKYASVSRKISVYIAPENGRLTS